MSIIPDARSDTLIPIIREKIRPDSIVYTDAFKSYDVLDVSEFKHLRINHSVLFADQHNHINGMAIVSFANPWPSGYNPLIESGRYCHEYLLG